MQSHAWCIDFAQRLTWKFRKKNKNLCILWCLRSVNSIKISAAKCLDSGYGVGEQLRIFTFWSPPKSHSKHSLIHPSHNINGWCGGVIRLENSSFSCVESLCWKNWSPLLLTFYSTPECRIDKKMYLKKSRMFQTSWGPIPNWRFGSNAANKLSHL